MKHVFQIIEHGTGKRSPHFTCTIQELRETLERTEDLDQEDLLLIVATQFETNGDEQVHISTAPLITIGSFLDIKEKAANG